MNIVTGYRGEAHITAWQDRDVNRGAFGNGNYILGVGSKMAATVVDANTIRIADGALSMNGCVAVIQKGTYDSVTIANGSQGMLRTDLIVARYTKASGTGVENIELAVIQGTPTSGTPTTPSYTSGDIQSGDSLVEFPLYKVNLAGLNVSTTLIAEVLLNGEDVGDLNALVNALNNLYGAIANRLTTAEGDIDALESLTSPLIKSVSYSSTFTVSAGGTSNITGTMLGVSTPSGYTPLGFGSISNNISRNIVPYNITPYNTGSNTVISLYNSSSSSVSGTITIRILYIKSSALG